MVARKDFFSTAIPSGELKKLDTWKFGKLDAFTNKSFEPKSWNNYGTEDPIAQKYIIEDSNSPINKLDERRLVMVDNHVLKIYDTISDRLEIINSTKRCMYLKNISICEGPFRDFDELKTFD